MTITARVASLIFNQPLLVMPETAATIATALADRFAAQPLGLIEATPGLDGFDASRFVGRPVEQRLGNGDVRNVYRVEDGVALVNVHGEMVNRGAWIGASSGLTSYEGLDASLRAARDDASVRAIVLDINSPGGSAAGAMETAALVRQVAGKKPVVAFVNAMASSAAYAIASGATRIVAAPSAMLGSIGVVWMHMDRSAQMDRAGVKPTLITAGAYKADGHPFAALPDDSRARIQSQIDAVYALFVDTVAAHRGLDSADIRKTEAGVFMGRAAVDIGLADQVGALDDVFAFLNRDRTGGRPSLGGIMSKTTEGATGADTPVYTESQHQDALAEESGKAFHAGAEAERERIGAILGSDAAKGRETLAHHFAFKSSMPADAALAALEAAPLAAAAPAETGPRLGALVPRPAVQPDPAAGPATETEGRIAALQAAVPTHLRRKSA